MSEINPEQEQQRLAKTYARFTDGELERAAANAQDLTDLAKIALRSEIDRRGAAVIPTEPEPEPAPEPEFRELVTIRQFRDLPEALLAKGSLESAGIECGLWDDNLVRLDWFWSNLIGGVRLKVAPADAEAANEILDQPIPEELDVPGIGDYHQPHCPKCNSLEIAYRELNKPVAYISAYFNVPMPLERLAWHCHDCGAEWEDTDVAPAEPEI
jgi:hypothetical protein